MDEPQFYAIDPLDAYPEAVGTLDKIEHSDGALWVHLNGKRSKLVGLQSLTFLIGQLEQIRAQVFGGGVEVKRYFQHWNMQESYERSDGEWVKAADHFAAGAALREELATANQVIEIQREGLLKNGGVLRQLLTAAEQRNAELVAEVARRDALLEELGCPFNPVSDLYPKPAEETTDGQNHE
jgi:hypothetical protein